MNRVFDGKDFGLVIDYRGIFGEVNQALEIYAALELEGFDRDDIIGSLVDIQVEIAKLPTHHAAVWDAFKGVSNLQDSESLQQWLQPQDRRDTFYENLKDFGKTLKLALSNAKFHADTPETTKQRYHQDLKYFLKLRDAVKRRYAETVNYAQYETQIRQMVVKEIGAGSYKTSIEPIDIFNIERFDADINKIIGDAAKADAIASRIKKVATEKMSEDPILYLQLSQLIQSAIDAHRAKRLSDRDYLQQMQEHLETARTRGANNVPTQLKNREQARAYYNILKDKLEAQIQNLDLLVSLATGIDDIIIQHKVRDWHTNQDIKNQMHIAIDDLVHDLKKTHNLFIPWKDLDEIVSKIMNIAEHYEVI